MKNSMERVLHVCQLLKNGEKLTADQLAEEFNVHRETIKRYITMIRESLEQEGMELKYNRLNKNYEVERSQLAIVPAQIFTILSVLHGSRTLNKSELQKLEETLLNMLPKDAQLRMSSWVKSFRHHYRASTNDELLPLIELLLDSIAMQNELQIKYITAEQQEKTMKIAPYTIIFDEGYLYVVVMRHDKKYDHFFNLRIDRIADCKVTGKKFVVNHSGNNFFRPGEYANKSAKMFSGERPVKIKIRVQTKVVSYFEDKFPLSTLLSKDEEWSTYEFEVLGEEGALFWILSQRERVQVLGPKETRAKLKKIIDEMGKLYAD